MSGAARSPERAEVAALPPDSSSAALPPASCSLGEAIEFWAERQPSAAAIAAPGRPPLTYADLSAQSSAAARALHDLGIAPRDRLARVLPPGPEAAVAAVATAARFAAAPLDPGLRAGEYRARLAALSPRALVVAAGPASPATEVADELGIAVIELCPSDAAPAGIFTLRASRASGGAAAASSAASEPAGLGDVALILPTSGTTARPRLVPLTHANVISSARAMAISLQLGPADRCLDLMPLFHVHGLMALIASLAAGGSVGVTPRFDADRVLEWMDALRASWYTASPAIHQAVALAARRNPPSARLRFIRSCSAPLPPALAAELGQRFGTAVLEAYGMTEATHQIAVNPPAPRAQKAGSVGLAAGAEVAIVDAGGRRLGAGESGEIAVRGPGVTAGYLGDPDATAEAFRDGWLRTGDLGHVDADGYLFITGRLKEMINRGGEKIAPREVDDVLAQHPAVARAVSFAVPHATLGEDVAAAVILRESAVVGAQELRAFAAARLADFKVPGRVFVVDDIPTTASGKPQRAALAERLMARPRADSGAPAKTDAERAVAGVWAEVLGLEAPPSRDASFFDLGGSSIHAAQCAARLAAIPGYAIALRDVFDWPTVAALAAHIESGPAPAAPGRADLGAGRAIPRLDPDLPRPLSLAQETLWTLQQIEPGLVAYNVPRAARLRGPLDAAALTRALQELVARHTALRTAFAAADPEPVQIARPAGRLDVPIVDLGECPEERREAELRRCLAADAGRPFDLASDPMLRVLLVRLSDADHVLLMTAHHLASDGGSAGIIARELSLLYAACRDGREPALPPLPIEYADWAAWQRQWLAAGARSELLAYWRNQLRGAPPALDLPADRPRPRVQSYRGARRRIAVSPALTGRLESLSRGEHATLFMTLLAAFAVLLGRLAGQDDVVVGTASAGRTRPEVEELVGLFATALALRVDLAGGPSFRQLLRRVRETCLGAYAHQELPFGALVDDLRPARDLSRPPLFQVMFVLQSGPEPVPSIAGVAAAPVPVDTGGAKFDLTLELAPADGGLAGSIEYNTDLFDESTIAGLAERLGLLWAAAAVDPDERISHLPLVTPAERHRITAEWVGARRPAHAEQCLHEIFEEQAERTPDAPALVERGRPVAFAELNRRANRLAHHLARRGVRSGERVGVLLERGADAVAAMLAAMKLGAAFLPLDPRYPRPRIAYMLGDARPAAVVTRQPFDAMLDGEPGFVARVDADGPAIAAERDEDPSTGVSADRPAYVIYTSGSTGRPRGVVGLHRGMVNVLAWLWEDYPFAPGELACQKTPLSFVDSVWEVFAPLLRGVPSLIVADEDVVDPRRLVAALAEARVTRIVLVPSLLQAMLDQTEDLARHLPALALWLVGGEELSPALAERFLRAMPQATLVNQYGASEASAVSTAWTVTASPAGELVPIGRPIRNTRARVLDRHGQLVPAGVEGQLYVGGVGLAAGYLGQPDLTAERFVPDSLGLEAGGRLYRTGDRARHRKDGAIEYLGRVDQQIKLRGFRIEPSEIEAMLRGQPGIRDTVVAVADTGSERARLVAYVVADGAEPESAELRRALRSRLPDYMIPSAFARLDALPLTPSGKVDRNALPAPPATRADARVVRPAHALELQLVNLWESLLGVSPVGVTDDFFELGGHSLLAVRMLRDAERVCGQRLALTAFFEDATIKHLADVIARQRAADGSPLLTQVRDGSRPPFFFLHGDYTGGGFYCRELARALGPDQPFYALHPHGVDGRAILTSIEDMAEDHLQALRRVSPRGPYFLGGHCNGGLVAFEIARRLRAAGEPVPLLVLIEASTSGAGIRAAWRRLRREGARLLKKGRYHLDQLARVRQSGHGAPSRFFLSRLVSLWQRLRRAAPSDRGVPDSGPADLREVYPRAVRRYAPGRYDGPVVVFRAAESRLERPSDLGWGEVADRVEPREARGAHLTMITWHVAALGEQLRACLERAQAPWVDGR